MSGVYFFIGCLAFFGIPALCVVVYASIEQKKLSEKTKRDFLTQYE